MNEGGGGGGVLTPITIKYTSFSGLEEQKGECLLFCIITHYCSF